MAATATMAKPRISVVMATYDRAETLRDTFAHLQAQTLPPEEFEVIVVDDGSPDHTPEVVAELTPACRFPVRYLRHDNHGPGYTQNRGMRLARAPLVLLIADDIFLAPHALEEHLRSHAAHVDPRTAVLGRVLQSPRLDQSLFLRRWDPWRLSGLADGTELPYYMFWACNVSFKLAFMLEHGMFRDERGRAGAAAHEDAELGHRLLPHGLRVVAARDALGYHHHVETLDGTLQRSLERGRNFIDFSERVPNPEIDVVYRTYDFAWLVAQAGALRDRQAYLLPADRGLARLAARHAMRMLVFNDLLVDRLWLPLLRAAEHSSAAAALARPGLYRGSVVNYFLRGLREARRNPGGMRQPRAAA
jgi:glycosyltransferase involved in cell wall biosynthesis